MLTRAIHRHSFKYEDLLRLSKVFEQNFWCFTWDLESGYHYVDIFSGHQKFLGFSWPFSGKVHLFTFRVVPLGLNSACFCFMKLLRPLVKRRRSMGHCCFVYLDDGISGLPERVSTFADCWVYQKDLKSFGLTLNREKSKLEPMQVGLWLGFVTERSLQLGCSLEFLLRKSPSLRAISISLFRRVPLLLEISLG